jgi:hypothetical protein
MRIPEISGDPTFLQIASTVPLDLLAYGKAQQI